MKQEKITKILSSAAMAAMMASPAATMAANTSTLDNPAGGAPILVEHPQTTEQHDGQNTTKGNGAKQAVNATIENVAYGTDASISVANGAQDASFDTAVGHEANIKGSAGTAVGAAAKVDALFGGTALGTASTAKSGQMGTAVGYMSSAEGNFATAVGANAKATAVKAEALGANAKATANNATALGVDATASAVNSVALGNGSVADEANTVSVGKAGSTRKVTNMTAGVNGTDGVNVSQLKEGLAGKADVNMSNLTDAGKQVIKNLAQANVNMKSTSGAVTVKKAVANGETNFDINLNENQKFNKVEANEVVATSTNTNTLTVKGNSTVGTSSKDTMTVNATTNLKSNVTVGGDAHFQKNVTVDGATNFNGNVTFHKAATFGDNVEAKSYSVNGEKYVTELGLNANNHKIVNVADGTVAAGSKDAVNGGQLYNAINTARNGVKDDINQAAGEVGAQAAAMSALHPLEFDKHNKFSVAASVGGYKDETAGAVGAFYRPDTRTILSVQGGIGNGGDNMWAVGYGQKFGGSSVADEIQTNSDAAEAIADLQNKYNQLLKLLSNQSKLPAHVVSGVIAPQGEGNIMSRVAALLNDHDAALDSLDENCTKPEPWSAVADSKVPVQNDELTDLPAWGGMYAPDEAE